MKDIYRTMASQNILNFYGTKLDLKVDYSELYDFELAKVDDDYDASLLDLTTEIEFDYVTTHPLTGTYLSSFQKEFPGYTYLYVTGGTISAPTSGILYVRYGSAPNYQTIQWNTSIDVILPKRVNYYNGNKQVLSTPFQFYFGLIAGATGMDKFIELYGPKGAFTSAD